MGCVKTKSNEPIIIKVKTKEERRGSNIFQNSQSVLDESKQTEISFIRSTGRKKSSGDKIKIATRNLIKESKPSQIDENYKVLNKLGKGAFGTVYKVVEKSTGFIKAMKVIKKESIKFQDDEKLFLKEIEILMNTDHPHIIKI